MTKTSVVHHFGPDPHTLGGMATVIRVLTEHRVGGDLVVCHPTWRRDSILATSRLVAAATRILRTLPTSHVAHIHLSEGGSFLREGSLLAAAHRRGLVTVATIHGAAFLPFAQKHPRLVSSVLRRTHLVICLDQLALEVVRAHAPDVISEIVPNPVVVSDSFPPADSTEEVVVFAGEIGTRKGADVLCAAWTSVAERCPKARCLMVGPITDYVPPHVSGLVVRPPADAAEMDEILRQARVVALPSRAEGMPMILTEAMALGRPFVSTPVGGIPELAHGGGLIVDVDDATALAGRLTDLLSHPELARAIGDRGHQFCLETRSTTVIDQRLREMYARARETRDRAQMHIR